MDDTRPDPEPQAHNSAGSFDGAPGRDDAPTKDPASDNKDVDGDDDPPRNNDRSQDDHPPAHASTALDDATGLDSDAAVTEGRDKADSEAGAEDEGSGDDDGGKPPASRSGGPGSGTRGVLPDRYTTDEPLPGYLAEAFAAAEQACEQLLQARAAALTGGQARALLAATTALVARVYAAHLHAITIVDDHPDAVPKARYRTGAEFLLRHKLRAHRAEAARDATLAHLLAETGDLPAVGQALRDGLVGRDAALVCADVHRRLGAPVRERRDEHGVRLISEVDQTLAEHAQTLTHPELRAAGETIVNLFNEPRPDGAHDRRYLHLSRLPDGSAKGRFACGPTQAALLAAAIAAGAAPRPGTAIDPDGVTHTLRDERTVGQRQIDALADLVAAALAKTSTVGITLPAGASPTPDPEPWTTEQADHDDTAVDDTDPGDDDTVHDTEPAGEGDERDAGQPVNSEHDDSDSDAVDGHRNPHPHGADIADGEAGDDPDRDPDGDLADEHSGRRHRAGHVVFEEPDERHGEDGDGADPPADRGDRDDGPGDPSAVDPEDDEPPPREGEEQVLRPPGVLTGPYPNVEILLVATLADLTAALDHEHQRHQQRNGSQHTGANAWPGQDPLIDVPQHWHDLINPDPRSHPHAEDPPDNSGDHSCLGTDTRCHGDTSGTDTHDTDTCDTDTGGTDTGGTDTGTWGGASGTGDQTASPSNRPGPGAAPSARPASLSASPAGWARAEHSGPVAPATLARLACSGTLRRVLTGPAGAVLDLGRTHRYATPAQRKALAVRDRGCLIPGCPAAATDCDIHHPKAWADNGPTDLENLVLLCSRHHTETHEGTWQIVTANGLPWIRPPRWLHPDQPLLRNTLHGTP